MLKILAAHPDILISHNLLLKDDSKASKLFKSLKKREAKTITTKELKVTGINALGKKQLVVKQGVWKHAYSFDGFMLVRNPFSVYCSLKTYDADENWYHKEHNFWQKTQDRLVRWLSAMQPKLADQLTSLSPVDQFCLYYNYRMNDLLTNNLPLCRYEDLVTAPETEFRRICDALEVEFYAEMLNAHQEYKPGTMAHGKNDMSRAVDQSSINRCSGLLTQLEFDCLLQQTAALQNKFGYKISGSPDQVTISW